MTFALDIEAFCKKVGANADIVVRKIGVDVLTSVVKKSPVKSGRFRANWTVSIGAVLNRTVETLDPNGDATIAEQGAKVANFSVGPSIYLTNSLPYAQRLENGYSRQAPAGMVRLTVAEFQTFVDDAVRQLP